MKSCLFLAVALLSVPSVFAEWQIEPVALGTWCQSVALDLGPGGLPRIAYALVTGEQCYAYHDGDQWIRDTVTANGTNGSLYMDPWDDPHITYFCDSQLMYALKYEPWYITTVDSGGEYSSFTLDSDFHQHVAYYDQINEDLKYAYYAGAGGWISQIVDSDGNTGMYPSLVLDSTDTPHIVYFDYSEESLYYARWLTVSWGLELIHENSYAPPYWNSLAIDSQDRLHLAFCTFCTPEFDADLFYATRGEYTWEIEVVDSVGQVGKNCSIALDPEEYPAISYRDADDNTLKFAHWDGSSWQIETVADSAWQYTSLGITDDGVAHIAYSNVNGLMHAWQANTGIGAGESVGSMTLGPNPSAGSFCLDFSVSARGVVNVSMYDLTGRLAYRAFEGELQEGYNSIEIDCSDLPTGVYVVNVRTGAGSSARKVLLIE